MMRLSCDVPKASRWRILCAPSSRHCTVVSLKLAERQEVNEDEIRQQKVYYGSGADAKITSKVRFFRTPDGHAYGFTAGGKRWRSVFSNFWRCCT